MSSFFSSPSPPRPSPPPPPPPKPVPKPFRTVIRRGLQGAIGLEREELEGTPTGKFFLNTKEIERGLGEKLAEGKDEALLVTHGLREPPPEPPGLGTKEVQEAAAESLRRRQKKRGFRSTILASALMSEDTSAKLAETLGS